MKLPKKRVSKDGTHPDTEPVMLLECKEARDDLPKNSL